MYKFKFEDPNQVGSVFDNLIRKKSVFSSECLASVHEDLSIKDNSLKYFLCFNQNKILFLVLCVIKKIPIKIENKNFFDLSSPYGYPGLLWNVNPNEIYQDEKNINKLKDEIGIFFSNKNIVTSFIRHNPTCKYAKISRLIFDNCVYSKIVNVKTENLSYLKEFSKGHKYDIKKGERLGLKVTRGTNDILLENFISIYKETMDRLNASELYFVTQEKIKKIRDYLKDDFVLMQAQDKNDTVLASSLFLKQDDCIYYYLSGSREIGYKLNASKFILNRLISFAHSTGVKKVILGGGMGGNETSSLYRFKAGFSKNRENFYSSRMIHNNEIYNRLKIILNIKENNQDDFFPIYRK